MLESAAGEGVEKGVKLRLAAGERFLAAFHELTTRIKDDREK